MARMVLGQASGLPAGIVAEALRKAFPDHRWQVGDGPQEGVVPLDRPASIFGRAGDGFVMLGVELVAWPLDDDIDAPPHAFHVRLTGPSTDDRAMAERMLAIVGHGLAVQGTGALQLAEGDPWLDSDELSRRAAIYPSGSMPEQATAPPTVAQPVPAPAPPPPLLFPRGTGNDRPPFGRKKG